MSDYITSVFDIKLLTLAFTIFLISLLELKDALIIKTKFLNKIFQNDLKGPLMYLDAVRNTCDEENKFTFLIDSVFEGIEGGLFNNYNYSPCKIKDINCTNIPTIPKQPLRAWADKALCVKRMDMSTIDFSVIKKDSSCPEQFKQCGVYNNFGDIMCIDKANDCPISYIKFTKDVKEILYLDKNIYDYIGLNFGYYLIYSNKLNNTLIPVDFKISEDYPCLEIERISYNESFPYYPFTNNSDLMGCNTNKLNDRKDGYDKRYSIVASDTKENVLANNDLGNRYSRLPKVKGWTDDSKKNQYQMFVRGYISLDYSCTDHETYQEFKLNLVNLKLDKFYQLLVSLVNVLILLLFISILSLFKLFSSWLKLFIRFVKICLSTLFVVFLFSRMNYTNALISSLKNFVQIINKCGDEFTTHQLERYLIVENIQGLEFIEVVLFYTGIISSVNIGILLVCLVFKTYVRIKNRKRRKIAKAELGHGSKGFIKDKITAPFKLFSENGMTIDEGERGAIYKLK